MKRNIMLIILLVLLAATINLAGAISFWFFGERPPNPTVIPAYYVSRNIRPQDSEVWRNRRDVNWPSDPKWATKQSYIGITFRSLFTIYSYPRYSASTFGYNYTINIVEAGYPMRCIAGEQWDEGYSSSNILKGNTGMSQAFGYQWPNRLLWSGMFINVLFYSALIALAYFCVRYSRRAMRKKRGHCLKCAYDLRGDYSAGCSECGYGREQA